MSPSYSRIAKSMRFFFYRKSNAFFFNLGIFDKNLPKKDQKPGKFFPKNGKNVDSSTHVLK